MSHHFKLISSETVDLTPQLAADFAAMPASLTEREIKPKRVEHLKDAVLGGRALAFNWMRAKVTDSGILYRVNGQHSSAMLTQLNGQFPDDLKVHIDDYEVPDNASLALLFRQIDNRMSARTIEDISGAYQGLQTDLVDVPRSSARRAIEGAAWYRKKIIGDDVPTGDERFSLFNDTALHPFIQMVGRIVSAKTPESTTPVIGTMCGTWEREPSVSEVFWDEVAKQGGGNEENHPTTALDKWLLEARERDDKPREMEVHRTCVLAWNAHRHGRTLDRIGKYDPKKGSPDIE